MPRTDGLKKAQAVYERGALATEKHVAVNLKLKSADDVEAMKALRGRFPNLTDSGIVRRAFRELAARELGARASED